MNRVIISLILVVGAVSTLSASDQDMKHTPMFWSVSRLDNIKQSVKKDPLYKDAFKKLIRLSESYLKLDNLSVMNKPMTPASGTKHDYMSLLRYCWPNPDTADGLPYVYRDGITNPEISKYDHDNLDTMTVRVCNLSLAYYFTGKKRYSEKAVSLIRTWFLDEETRVNPNMNRAQIIPGLYNGVGRPSGIVDSYFYLKMIDALVLLERSKGISQADMDGMRKWFDELSYWMRTMPIPMSVDKDSDNKAVIYDVQLVRFAIFCGRDSLARAIVDSFPAKRLNTQIAADGSQPEELNRTRPMHYSLYNMEHLIDMCDMGSYLGVKMFNAHNGAIGKSFEYVVPILGAQDKTVSGNAKDRVNEDFSRLFYRASIYGDKEKYRSVYRQFKAPAEDYMFTLLYLDR